MTLTDMKRGDANGGGSGNKWQFEKLLSGSTKRNEEKQKEWKFQLSEWTELNDIWSLVGSSFLVTCINSVRTTEGRYNYEIVISGLPSDHPMASLYPSIIDSVKKGRRNIQRQKRKTKKKKSK